MSDKERREWVQDDLLLLLLLLCRRRQINDKYGVDVIKEQNHAQGLFVAILRNHPVDNVCVVQKTKKALGLGMAK